MNWLGCGVKMPRLTTVLHSSMPCHSNVLVYTMRDVLCAMQVGATLLRMLQHTQLRSLTVNCSLVNWLSALLVHRKHLIHLMLVLLLFSCLRITFLQYFYIDLSVLFGGSLAYWSVRDILAPFVYSRPSWCSLFRRWNNSAPPFGCLTHFFIHFI